MLLADMSNSETQKDVNSPVESNACSPNKSPVRKLVELKSGKVLLRQKPLSCEKMSETMQEIVNFRDFLQKRAKDEQSPLLGIPDEHLPLIAKLVHESDKTLPFLAKHIQEALQPEESMEVDHPNDALLPTPVIESAILQVCDRINYGMDWAEKASASLNVWRWEVKGHSLHFLPRAFRDKFVSRQEERRLAKKELKALFEALPQAEKDTLAKSGKKTKLEGPLITTITDENKTNETPLTHNQSESAEDPSTGKKQPGRPKKEKPLDVERLKKEKEKAERKAAREEKERKQQEAVNKSRSIMSSFFAKPKGSSSKLLRQASATSSSNGKISSAESEFEKTFRPFILRKDASLAPINHFRDKDEKEVIEIDQGTFALTLNSSQPDPSQEHFPEYIARLSTKLRRRPRRREPNYKSFSTFCIRDLVAQLSEAEVSGDDDAVRSLQALLRSRDRIPAKVLIFHEDIRPGYYGTFTKSSVVVGPRTPFGRDALAFDYGYDSGEDWEEEEEGGEDLLSLNGSDVGESSDVAEGEFDDWLVDDDEAIEPGTPLSERAGSPTFPLPQDIPKRKVAVAVEAEAKEPKKRKVMPLVPFSKGPCYEENIGHCQYEPFQQYRIHLFNDTPFPIDPFTHISTPVVLERHIPAKHNFAVPALPPHIQAANSNTVSAIIPSSDPSQSNEPSTYTIPATLKRVPLQPKVPFPSALLPYFADKVASLSSGNLTWLVESLYQDLRAHRVKKNAIEAKVREDCEKCPVRKVWIVKDDVLRTLGRAPAPLPSS